MKIQQMQMGTSLWGVAITHPEIHSEFVYGRRTETYLPRSKHQDQRLHRTLYRVKRVAEIL